MLNDSSHILVAELKSAYGIKGWLWLYSFTDPKETIFSYSPLIYMKNNIATPLKIEKWRTQGKGLVVKLENVNDRSEAESYIGTQIWLAKENLPQLNDDEIYWKDLYQLNVINLQNEKLGIVEEVFETNAHAIMKIFPNNSSIDNLERLIPFHKHTVVSVDLEKQIIQVDWMNDY